MMRVMDRIEQLEDDLTRAQVKLRKLEHLAWSYPPHSVARIETLEILEVVDVFRD